MEDCNTTKTPMPAGLQLEFTSDETGGLDDSYTAMNYQKEMGSLQYLTTCTHPDLSYTVNYLSHFNSQPNKAAWNALRGIFRYLQGTKDFGIIYKANKAEGLYPVTYSDSDWAGMDPGYHSTSGFIISMNGAPVSWQSQHQLSVSKSTTKAKYITSSKAACKLIWLADLLDNARLIEGAKGMSRTSNQELTLQVDNKGAIDLSNVEALTHCSCHIEICHHLIHDWVRNEVLNLEHISTTANKADRLTKALPREPYKEFVNKLGVVKI